MRLTRPTVLLALLTLAACGGGDTATADIDELQQQVSELQAENDQLRSQQSAPPATEAEQPTTVAPSTTSPPPASTDESAGSEPPSTSTTTEAEPPVPDLPEPTCTYAGLNGIESMQVELNLTNPSAATPRLSVTYALLDEEGTRFFDRTEDLRLIGESEQVRQVVSTSDDLPAEIDEASIACTVLGIESRTSAVDYTAPASADTCAIQSIEPGRSITTELAVTSPFLEAADVQIFTAFIAPDGTRFADAVAQVDLLGPGETIAVIEDEFVTVPDWADGDPTCTILGIWNRS